MTYKDCDLCILVTDYVCPQCGKIAVSHVGENEAAAMLLHHEQVGPICDVCEDELDREQDKIRRAMAHKRRENYEPRFNGVEAL